jgi:hypothetical protein
MPQTFLAKPWPAALAKIDSRRECVYYLRSHVIMQVAIQT